jgi:hypothetical protein
MWIVASVVVSGKVPKGHCDRGSKKELALRLLSVGKTKVMPGLAWQLSNSRIYMAGAMIQS